MHSMSIHILHGILTWDLSIQITRTHVNATCKWGHDQYYGYWLNETEFWTCSSMTMMLWLILMINALWVKMIILETPAVLKHFKFNSDSTGYNNHKTDLTMYWKYTVCWLAKLFLQQSKEWKLCLASNSNDHHICFRWCYISVTHISCGKGAAPWLQ